MYCYSYICLVELLWIGGRKCLYGVKFAIVTTSHSLLFPIMFLSVLHSFLNTTTQPEDQLFSSLIIYFPFVHTTNGLFHY